MVQIVHEEKAEYELRLEEEVEVGMKLKTTATSS